ncbi:MAG: hypothetical protein KKF41_02235 [Actinobacteria bacterium]|nr:hypothetical protein [Actinomycetota bacterium]MBU1942305.1 hypothetical protein [Actinomycetota bacterium]MBU2686386.1 hypothetical protein [Actinomycetota bacterium]
MIVQFKEGIPEEAAREVVSRHQTTVIYIWNTRPDCYRWAVSVRIAEGKDEDQAIEEFEAEPTVEYAERSVILRPVN